VVSFLKTTALPAAEAGFGVNADAPDCPMIRMVTALPPLGVVFFPLQLETARTVTAHANAVQSQARIAFASLCP
jgi:hypothetical protein